MTSVAVKLFAAARELAGAAEVAVDCGDQPTIADVRKALAEAHPPLAELLSQAAFAIDASYAAETTPVPDGAEVACIPPVSGG